MPDEHIKANAVMTCTVCGCLVSASYWATHTGVCSSNKTPNVSQSKEYREQILKAKGYWR